MQYTYYTTLRRGQIGRVQRQQGGAAGHHLSGKVNPGFTLHSIVSAPVLLLVTCGYYYVHRCSQEINITRGFHPCAGAQGANLVSRSGLSQCSDTEPDQETATEMSFRPLGSIPCGILILLNIQIITLL